MRNIAALVPALRPLAFGSSPLQSAFLGLQGSRRRRGSRLAHLDKRRKNKGSNDDWTHPDDPDATIGKMKDGCTHLAHQAEQARQGGGTSGSVREPAADPGRARQALVAAARRAGRTQLCALIRDGLDAANPFKSSSEYPQEVAASCGCIQSLAGAATEAGSGHAARLGGSEKGPAAARGALCRNIPRCSRARRPLLRPILTRPFFSRPSAARRHGASNC